MIGGWTKFDWAFLAKRVFAAHNADIPAARRRLADIVETRYKKAADNQEVCDTVIVTQQQVNL